MSSHTVGRGALLVVALAWATQLAARADEPTSPPPPPSPAMPQPIEAYPGDGAAPPAPLPAAAPAATAVQAERPQATVTITESPRYHPAITTDVSSSQLVDEISRGHSFKIGGEVMVAAGAMALVAGLLVIHWAVFTADHFNPEPLHAWTVAPILCGVALAGIGGGIPVYLYGRRIEREGVAKLPHVAIVPTLGPTGLTGGAASLSFAF